MPPRGSDLKQKRRSISIGAHDSRVALHQHFGQLVVKPVFAKLHFTQATVHCLCHQDCSMFDVGIDHRHAARSKPFEYRGFLDSNFGDVRECLKVNGGNCCDQCYVRACKLGQRGNLSGMVHADLDHGIIGVDRHPCQCQGNTPVIVVALDRCMCPPLICEDRQQHFLGGRFAYATGHRRDFCPRAGPRSRPQRLKSAQHVLYNKQRRVSRNIVGNTTYQRRPRPFFQSRNHKIMAVTYILEGDEQVARFDRAGINGYPVTHPITLSTATGGLLRLCCRPQAHASLPSSAATATLACSTSSNGKMSSPIICPVS